MADDDRTLDAQSDPEEELIDETGGDADRRGLKAEAERGQGAKTRQLNKDIVSRRS